MSIYSRTVVRGCGLVGGVLLLLLLLSPTMSYRLQSQQQQSLSSKSTQQRNHSQQNHNYNASSRSSSIGSPWPPRIPLWGFLPSSSSSASSPSTSSSSYSSSNHHPNSINHAVAAANSLNAKPSKRESSPSSHNNKGLNNANHLKSNMVDPHHQRPHHFPSTFDTFEDDNDDDDNLLFDDGSSINDDDDAWLVNLKRSSNNLGQQRSGVKRNRIYDVPQIECPPAEDGMERFACPTPDKLGRYPCVDDHVLCDGFVDCPGREDEDRQACMFYKTTKAHLDVLADALLRWARGRR